MPTMPRKVPMKVKAYRLPPPLIEAVSAEATRRGWEASEVAREALERGLKSLERESAKMPKNPPQ